MQEAYRCKSCSAFEVRLSRQLSSWDESEKKEWKTCWAYEAMNRKACKERAVELYGNDLAKAMRQEIKEMVVNESEVSMVGTSEFLDEAVGNSVAPAC